MFDKLPDFVSVISEGLLLTVGSTFGGIAIASVLSLIFGLGMLARSRLVRGLARVYVEIWRGTSEVVQLFFFVFVLPILVGYQIVPLVAGILVLGMNFGAYGAEIVRGAVQSVPRAQHEGCVALNLTVSQRMRRVILPQAMVEMLPPFNNLFIQLLKGSSLLMIVGVSEMTRQAYRVLIPRNVDVASTATIWVIVLLFYLALAILITMGMRWLERRAAALVGRIPPPRQAYFAKVGTSGEAVK